MPEIDGFLDSNVVLYALSREDDRAEIAEDLLLRGGTVSVQVLNEVANVAHRKGGHPWHRVHDLVGLVCERCRVVPLTVELHFTALEIAERYGFTIYDASIWAAARHAGCSVLYSEDMQNGQTISGTRLVNPFL